MKTITTALKKKCFTQDQKRFLYGVLQKDAKETWSDLEKTITSFAKELIKTYILTKDSDLGYLSTKRYCSHTGNVTIMAESLGLPRLYNEYPGVKKEDIPKYIQNVIVSLTFYMQEEDDDSNILGYPKKRGYGQLTDNVGELLIKNCPESLIEVLKEKMLELAKAEYEYRNYKADEVLVGNGNYHIIPFLRIQTWGQLLRTKEEWFDILYNKYEDTLSDEEKDEAVKEDSGIVGPKTIDAEIQGIRKLLGFGK